MKKIIIILGNSGCDNCISPGKAVGQDCTVFIDKMCANGLASCTEDINLNSNYIYAEKEKEMKNVEMKNELQVIFDMGGFIHILEYAGITQVFVPVSKACDSRMFYYGQSVCNLADKYKRKKGIKLALQDLKKSEKALPFELIELMFGTLQIEGINSIDLI